MKKLYHVLTFAMACLVMLTACGAGAVQTEQPVEATEVPVEATAVPVEEAVEDEPAMNAADVGYQITEAGTYTVSGEVIDTTITVDAGDDAKVKLVL